MMSSIRYLDVCKLSVVGLREDRGIEWCPIEWKTLQSLVLFFINCFWKIKLTAHLIINKLVTARKRSLGQGNIFSSMCQEFCSQEGGGSASVHAGIPPPLPGADTPQSRHPPDQASPRTDTPQTRHPPWTRYPPEQTPPCPVHAGRYGQQAGGMHPTGMQSC